jgi:hypothetical protein
MTPIQQHEQINNAIRNSEAQQIEKDKKYEWIEVAKERLGFKYSLDDEGEHKEVGIKDIIPEGYQVEYTRIRVKGKEYYTFNLEALSKSGRQKENFQQGADWALSDLNGFLNAHNQDLQVRAMYISHLILPKVKLQLENSMGYPQFFKNYCMSVNIMNPK